jgi:integrase
VYALHDAGSKIAANRLLAYIKKFFRFAIQRGKVDASPAALLERPTSEHDRKRDRVLTDAEIRAVWSACDQQVTAFTRAVKVMLVTGQRRDEVAQMCWPEIDPKSRLWTLPKARMKANREHQVPLSNLAIEIIGDRAGGDFVFTNTGGERPISGFSKGKENLDPLVLVAFRKAAADRGEDSEKANIPNWTLHDLRRTATTRMAGLGVDRIVLKKVIDHADSSVTAVYDRHRYDAEKRAALDSWATELQRILDWKPAEVVPFKGRRK